MKKADKVFVRIGFSDVVVPIEEVGETHRGEDGYIIGWEDEDGEECEKDGTYLNQEDE